MKYTTIGTAGDPEMKINDFCLHGFDNLVIPLAAIQLQIRKILLYSYIEFGCYFHHSELLMSKPFCSQRNHEQSRGFQSDFSSVSSGTV